MFSGCLKLIFIHVNVGDNIDSDNKGLNSIQFNSSLEGNNMGPLKGNDTDTTSII